MPRPVRGNAFNVAVTVVARRIDGTVIDDFALTSEAVLKITHGTSSTQKEYTIIDQNVAVIHFDGSDAAGIYGVEFTGEWSGEPWRFAVPVVFQVVELTTQGWLPQDGIIYEPTYEVDAEIVIAGGGGGGDVQADWTETDPDSPAYIQHKPDIYTQTETDTLLAGKQDELISGQNIKTINGNSMVGNGNLIIAGETVVVDSYPTKDSVNPVSSGGVYDALEEVNIQIDDTAHGNMIISEHTEPIIQSTTRGNKWGTSGLNYNDSAEFRGLECWGVRIVGVSGDVEIGKINVTTKSTSSIVTVSASEMTEGTFYDVLFDDVQILNSDEVLYLRGNVYWVGLSGVNCVLADNRVFTNVLAWIVPLVKVYEKTNILDEILKLADGELGENKGTSDELYANWYGFDTLRVTQNSIITQFRYRLVSAASNLLIKVVTLDTNNIVTAVRDYSFSKITNSESVPVQIPVTPNDIILCNGVSLTADSEGSKIVWMRNVEIGGGLSYNNNKYSIALEWDWVADTEVNRTVFASAEKIEFPNKKLKLAVLGDSIMATDQSGTGRYINAKLGTTLLKTTNNPDYGVFAVGWATLVDWVKNGVNSSTPTVNVSSSPGATNCITNQLRRLLQHTTALGQQITWTHPTEGDTYTIDTSVATGEGYVDDIPDVIFIAAGTNDWNAGDISYDKYTKFNAETGMDDYDTVIGQSYSELDRGTFSSCIRWIIETLKINYPNSHIIFGNIMDATSRTNWTTANQRSKLIEDICGWEGIPVIDTLRKSGLGGGTLGWLTDDGLHPNSTGRELLASFIASQIKSLVGELR